jgi:hypothetical protein
MPFGLLSMLLDLIVILIPDAVVAKNWVSQMDKLMEVMCCTDE